MREVRPTPGSSRPGQGWDKAVETVNALKAHPRMEDAGASGGGGSGYGFLKKEASGLDLGND